MVFLRASAWAWLGVLPVVWCLPLEGVRSAPQQQQPLSLLEDFSSDNLPPQDFTQDDYQPLLTRQPEIAPIAPLSSYDGSEGSPFVYRLQEGLAGAGVPDSGLASDVAGLDTRDWMAVDPRYYLLSQYLDRRDEATGSDIGSSSRSAVRKIRNSPNSSSSSSISSSSNFDNSNSKPKRAWPHGFSRRRSSGLSLSIDASMKVLREALYLEMARKKQRQQLQRARHNQQLLTTIGKRDVQHQLQEDSPDQDHLRTQRN